MVRPPTLSHVLTYCVTDFHYCMFIYQADAEDQNDVGIHQCTRRSKTWSCKNLAMDGWKMCAKHQTIERMRARPKRTNYHRSFKCKQRQKQGTY